MNQENRVLGVIGAIIGSLLGVVVWCLIAKLGYISWIGGLAISGLAFGGYALLGKDFSKFGVGFVIVLVIFMVYFATRMSYAVVIYDAFKEEGYDYTLGECFNDIMRIIELADCKFDFYKDLALGYLFTVLASVSVVKKFVM